MPSLSSPLAESTWQDASSLPHDLSSILRAWLLSKGSLTKKLKIACEPHGQFQVKVLSQDWIKPLPTECEILGMSLDDMAMARQVLLCNQDIPWVFARTIIPDQSLKSGIDELLHLGNKPLGEVLFNHSQVDQGAIEVTCLQAEHQFYQQAKEWDELPDELWGRRTLFTMLQQPLLVNEFFLPNLLNVKSS